MSPPRLIGGACSLRGRLLATVSLAVLMIWVLTGWFSYTEAQHEAEELMDGNLAQSGRLLLAITEDKGDVLVDVVVTDESGESPIVCEMVWAWVPKKR